ncbi:MAG: aminotransferase class V-fold PLP-dependent enzyme [Terriglobia bacterium]|jgi:selenocysteine lyase/cysteine desulfurase
MPLDVQHYRSQFPVTASSIYMNHAAVAPISQRVRDAMVGLLDDVQHFGAEHWQRWVETYAGVRRSLAQLINAEPDEIAFAKNTSEGISSFANGLDWQPGDEVVSIEGEFPANFYPWKALQKRGVVLRLVPAEEGRVSQESILRALTPRTRVVTVSFVQYLSGFRLDLEKLGKACAAHGCLLFVDAIQGLGAFPVDVRRANIAGLAADSHKWMLGPEGSALLYVNRQVMEKITPPEIGWMTVRHWSDFSRRDLSWREDARRYECGTLNTVGVYGLGAAVNLLLEVGIASIAERVLDLTDRLRGGLLAQGHSVFGPRAREEASGIVSFVPRQAGAERLLECFLAHRVQVAARCGMVRIAPHFYNTEEEIDRVLELAS